MAYDNTTPGANDRINQTQPLIQGNFADLKTYLDRNHVAISDPTANVNEGKHTIVQMGEQGVDATTSADEGAIYTKDKASQTELFYRKQSNGLINQLSVIKAWGSFNGTTGTLTDSDNIASVARTGAGTYVVTFTTALPTANYGVVVTGQMSSVFTTGGICGVDNKTTTNFQINVRSLTAATGADLNPVSFIVMG